MRHRLKILPQYYRRVQSGEKTFEVRKNDRDFQTGDIVELVYFDPDKGKYELSMPVLTFEIGYILKLDEEKVVFSLLKQDF